MISMHKIKISTPDTGKVQPFGQSISGSPDATGALRRARQMLAGVPSAIRTTKPRVAIERTSKVKI